jgi:hypothetical protein
MEWRELGAMEQGLFESRRRGLVDRLRRRRRAGRALQRHLFDLQWKRGPGHVDLGGELDAPRRDDALGRDAQAEAGPNFISGRAANTQPDGDVTGRMRWQ